MSFETMAMPKPYEDKNIPEQENEKESFGKKVWGEFINKFDEYTDEDSKFGKSVDWAKDKMEKLKSSDRLSFLDGLSKVGNTINGIKYKGMALASSGMADCVSNKHLKKLFEKNAEDFTEKMSNAYADIDKVNKGELKDMGRIKGVGQGLAGNFLRYGRIVSDVTNANPLRNVMAGSMFVGQQSEMIKLVRLEAEGALNKTRIGQLDEKGELINQADFDRAFEEANKLYEKAMLKNPDAKVSSEDLTKAYQENLPKDVLERFKRNENFEGSSFLQKGMIWHMKRSAVKVEAEIYAIEKSNINPAEKQAKIQEIFQRNKKLLKDLDGMVGDQGTIDTFAYLLRASEKTGKTVATVMTVETAAENLSRLGKLSGKLAKSFMNWTGSDLNAEESFSDQNETATTIKKVNEMSRVNEMSDEDFKIWLNETSAREIEKIIDTPFSVRGAISEERVLKMTGKVLGTGDIINSEASQVKVENFQIAEKINAKRGDSIWSMAEKYLEGNDKFKELKGSSKLREALETYNIDRIKDTIVANPEVYGLAKGVDVDKLSIKQLNEIKWQEAFDDTFVKKGDITEALSEQQAKGILNSNRIMQEEAIARKIKISEEETKVPTLEELENVEVEVPSSDSENIYIDNNVIIPVEGQFADEWKVWRSRSAADFLRGNYGEAVTSYPEREEPGKMDWEKDIKIVRPDAAEMNHRELLRERLFNAHDLIGDPGEGETVEHYFGRYNIENAEVNGRLYLNLQHEGVLTHNDKYNRMVLEKIDKMPSELKLSLADNFEANKNVALGYLKVFSGNSHDISLGIKKMFNYLGEINPNDLEIKSNGSVVYSNAFGRKGFDLIISKDKIGVDGPRFNNYHKEGIKMSLNTIRDSKDFIYKNNAKTIEEMSQEYVDSENGNVVAEKGNEEPVIESKESKMFESEKTVEKKPEPIIPLAEKIVESTKDKGVETVNQKLSTPDSEERIVDLSTPEEEEGIVDLSLDSDEGIIQAGGVEEATHNASAVVDGSILKAREGVSKTPELAKPISSKVSIEGELGDSTTHAEAVYSGKDYNSLINPNKISRKGPGFSFNRTVATSDAMSINTQLVELAKLKASGGDEGKIKVLIDNVKNIYSVGEKTHGPGVLVKTSEVKRLLGE